MLTSTPLPVTQKAKGELVAPLFTSLRSVLAVGMEPELS